MTHDELLAKIDSVFYEEEGGMQLDLAAFNNQYRALSAVVGLHRPIGDMCLHCGDDTYYPCQTIQAIEKELS